MDYFIRLPKKKNTQIIYDKVNELINKHFEKLNTEHKRILIKYLYRVILTAYFFFYDDKFIEQLYLNNYQDIFSFLVLMLPYYELNMSKNITSLDELFTNLNSKAKSLSSSYYIDHLDLKNDKDYLEKYFINTLHLISSTLENTHCSVMPNWLNIFPHTMDNYKTSYVYKNFKKLFNEREFYLSDENFYYDENTNVEPVQLKIAKNHFFLGFPKLYGTIYNFMYSDIKSIKWMIYDLNLDNQIIIPNIIYLCDRLKINSIANKPWNKLVVNEKNECIKLWEIFYKSNKTNKISLNSLVLFYLRWEKDNDNLSEIGLSKKCLEKIKTNLIKIIDDDIMNINSNIDDNDEEIMYKNNDDEISKCLEQILPLIKFEKIYIYMYECMQRFKFTWYGFICMDDNKDVLGIENFFKNYFNKFENINKIYLNEDKPKYYYVTPKNIYNFCKSLIHIQIDNNKYEMISLTPSWKSIIESHKKNFIVKLVTINRENWFNINRNLKRTYGTENMIFINEIMDGIKKHLANTDTFIDIIFQTLVYNGMFSYFKYNPSLTDNRILPDKNKNFVAWKNYILSNVDIKTYSKSYHPFSNTMLDAKIYMPNIDTVERIKNSLWYTNFGANWIAQIQLYHHYINNRVLYITGATGAGKSTVAPFLLVYAVKIIGYKNDAKVVCTQPRTQPVKDNSSRIAESIGYPIIIKKDDKLDLENESYKKTNINEGVPQDINYIQYKHMKGTLTDDLYHPYLRLYTDGSLYNIIKQSYLFKKIIPSHSDPIPEFTSSNLFDIILVDEAHEHNTNMDLILTLSKFATYVNNRVVLGIISATMDDDEIIYRKYYEPIDDNWKNPFNINDWEYNKNLIDRRIHLSIPFGGMNFEVKEYPNDKLNYPKNVNTFTDIKKINIVVKEVLKHILNTTQQGDILIFQPGESDIKKLLVEINKETPPNVLAIPFFSKLDNDILEGIVKKIDKNDVRKKIRYPKNKYDITQINDVPQNELLPEGTYKRFVVLATNIAEASITIDTFEYVIDIGNQKINIYDYKTNQSKLEIIPIAIPNQKQRKGRVGRVKPGNVFYTYDRFILSEKVIYKLNIENISSFIFDLVTTTNLKLINSNSDPNKISNLEIIPECLKEQYMYFENEKKTFLEYFNDKFIVNKRNDEKIIYPYADGKYTLNTLRDEDGTFFIIHPNEEYFEREPTTLEIISKNKLPNYFNKVDHVFNYGKSTRMIGENNLLTPYGILVNNLSDFMEFSDNSLDFTKTILDLYSFNLKIDKDKNFEIFKNVVLYFVFKNNKLAFKVKNYLVGKSDYLTISKQIENNLFNLLKLTDIYDYLKPDLTNFDDVIKSAILEILSNRNFDSNTNTFFKNIEEIKKVLISFEQIKLKLDLVNLNERNILKSSFEEIIVFIKKYKDSEYFKKNNISDKYLKILNQFELYYNNCDKFMKKNVLLKLLLELKKITYDKKLNKLTYQLSEKLDKIIFKTSLFENENLIMINMENNNKYTNNMIEKFNKLDDYDKLCFVICKNSIQNILVKVPYTEFYINYYDKDINMLYTLETIFDKYTKTKVPTDIRNYYILGMGFNDNLELNNIMVINENIIIMLDEYFNTIGVNLFKKNTYFDKEKALYIYGDKYMNILKKIDKITEYIDKS